MRDIVAQGLDSGRCVLYGRHGLASTTGRDRIGCAIATCGTRLWYPFASMGKVDGHELVLIRGNGARVWDANGNEYLDATAGL